MAGIAASLAASQTVTRSHRCRAKNTHIYRSISAFHESLWYDGNAARPASHVTCVSGGLKLGRPNISLNFNDSLNPPTTLLTLGLRGICCVRSDDGDVIEWKSAWDRRWNVCGGRCCGYGNRSLHRGAWDGKLEVRFEFSECVWLPASDSFPPPDSTMQSSVLSGLDVRRSCAADPVAAAAQIFQR